MAYGEVFSDERVLEVATVAKLTRNAMLVGVVPALALLHARSSQAGQAGQAARPSLAKLFPLFILGFLALSALRTLGDLGLQGGGAAFGLFSPPSWATLIAWLGERASSFSLGMALAGVGLTTKLSVFRGLGPRPFLVGLFAALWVGVVSAILSAWVGPLLAA